MEFGDAIRHMRAGRKITRTGVVTWTDRFLRVVDTGGRVADPLIVEAKDGKEREWRPHQADILATDWVFF